MAGTEKTPESDQNAARPDVAQATNALAQNPDDNSSKDSAPLATPATGSFAARAGQWAFDHKETMSAAPASLAYRNFARTLVAIAPYVVVNVAVQHVFKHTVNSGKTYGKALTSVLKQPIIQSAVAIATSFTAFRSTSKVWNDNYDRIFKAQSASDATRAVANLPGNIVHDYAKILPGEFAATGLSAIVLAGIRGGLKTPEPPGSQLASTPLDAATREKFPGGMKQLTGQFGNDYFANAMGYAPFFEVTDRLYSVFNKKHQNGVYVQGALPVKDGDSTPYDKLTGDTPGRLVFRNVGSVFAAAVPFIASMRYANMKTGYYNNKKNSYLKDVGIGLVAWELPFAVFTTGMEAWQRSYDKLFNKLQDKYSAQDQSNARTR